MNNVIVFDTETTGLPKSWSAPMTDVENWPRVIQLAWAVYSPEGELIKEEGRLVYPDGWRVPTADFWIRNGFTQEENLESGLKMDWLIRQLCEDMTAASAIVAHNMNYDRPVLGAEFIRYGLRGPKINNWLCTMKASTNLCKIPNNRGGFKWPTLTELYQFLFNEGFDGAHDALADVRACGRAYFELKKRRVM